MSRRSSPASRATPTSAASCCDASARPTAKPGEFLGRIDVDQLVRAGAVEGNAVTIGGVTFDWVPSLPAGTLTAEESAGLGGRGTDSRIDAPHRVRAEERLAAKKARRVPYELSEPGWTEEDLPEEVQ